MGAVFRRELKSFFYTPVGWLFLGVYLSLAGLLFYLNNILPRSSDLMPLLGMLGYVWMLLTPMLAMRLTAAERAGMTDRLLYTSPVPLRSILAGKYLAAAAVLVASVGFSLVYPLILSFYGPVHLPEVLTGYLGLALQGLAFLALDAAVTSRAAHAASAAALAFGVNLFVWLASLLSTSAALPAFVTDTVAFLSLYGRFVPFLNAQLSFASVLFYLLFILCMLAVALAAQADERLGTS
ncbi:MAG TPA: hypothetical protein VLA21_12145 [Candidatus Limnocylindria bacterium]|nr:hypothetical protein [Candidatus Limnocylindria bacterium]